MCFQCKHLDSLEHTFLECPVNVQFYQDILLWFNTLNNTHINLSVDRIFPQNYPPLDISDFLRRRLDLLILLKKRYKYSCKINAKNLNSSQCINKIKMHWRIENLTSSTNTINKPLYLTNLYLIIIIIFSFACRSKILLNIILYI